MNNIKKVSIVIPALNEEKGIGKVLQELPIEELKKIGYDTEVIVVDNGSTDNTKDIAEKNGATVIYQPLRGYGNAYKKGFSSATGNIIATGDADSTYPMSDIPKLVKILEDEGVDFINTDRLTYVSTKCMHKSHIFGNWVLTIISKILFSSPFKDSQSGMWVFKKKIWDQIDVQSGGMPFSQELKMEVAHKGFICAEVPIVYRERLGDVKLHPIKDAYGNVSHLFMKRLTIKR